MGVCECMRARVFNTAIGLLRTNGKQWLCNRMHWRQATVQGTSNQGDRRSAGHAFDPSQQLLRQEQDFKL